MTSRRRIQDGTRVSDYDYDLPDELIAQYPADRRDQSRLLVLPPAGAVRHRRFADFVDLLEAGDVLVVNESRVFPARLLGRKPTGASAEVLLLRPAEEMPEADAAADEAVVDDAAATDGAGARNAGAKDAGAKDDAGEDAAVDATVGDAPHPSKGAGATRTEVWHALVRPGGKLKPGRRVVVGEGLEVEILDSLPSGSRIVRLIADGDVGEALERHGRIPLPPYIGRADESLDRDRYQTVYASERGSIAAPTAGLHFTESVLDRIARKGVARAAITLHVGVGTFRPVEGDDPADHDMHVERYVVSPASADTINGARAAGGRVWAVGTTAVRTLETVADARGHVLAGEGETRLFVRPPYEFRTVDGLLTNFHLPRSTLLMLVAALAGYERTMAAYAEAIRERYRFYSYGDAMVVLPRGPAHVA